MSKTVILGLDISSKRTGYCVLRDGRWNKSKSSHGTIQTASDIDVAEKLVSFRDQLEELIKRVQPTHVIIEDVFSGRNVATMKLLARFSGVGIELCRRLMSQNPLIVTTTKVRAHFKCGQDKEKAFEYVKKRYHLADWEFKTHNDMADALMLALYQHSLL